MEPPRCCLTSTGSSPREGTTGGELGSVVTGVSIFILNVRCMTAWENVVANNNASRKQLIDVIIWETLLAEKEVIKVAETLEYAKYPRRMLDRPRMIIGNPSGIEVSSCILCHICTDFSYMQRLEGLFQLYHIRTNLILVDIILGSICGLC